MVSIGGLFWECWWGDIGGCVFFFRAWNRGPPIPMDRGGARKKGETWGESRLGGEGKKDLSARRGEGGGG